MSKLTSLQHLGVAFESTYGTGVAPVFYIPLNSAKPQDDVKKIQDTSKRASIAKVYAIYDGVTSSTFDLDLDLYPDAIGYLLKGIMGQDTVTGTSPNYTHTFAQVNALAPSMTLQYYNGIAEHQFAGSIMSELDLKFESESICTASAKFLGRKSAVVATTTPSYSGVAPFTGWGATLTINGTSNANIVGGEVNIKRDAKLLWTCVNSQVPQKQNTGTYEISGKLTFDVEDETELGYLGNGSFLSLVLTFIYNANTSLQITMSQVDVDKATVDTSQEFVRVDLDYTAIYNSTNAGLAQFVLKNQVASY